MKRLIKRFMSKHHRNKVIKRINKLFYDLHRGYENLNYDFFSNGEDNVLRKIKEIHPCSSIFDVGGNDGRWSLLTSKIFPNANIHAFEIVPDTFKKLSATSENLNNVTAHNIGLSDEEGTTSAYFSPDNCTVATCVTDFVEDFHDFKPEKIEVTTTTGDMFCKKNKIEAIDFLKIDVEGYEDKVLKGFEDMLQAGNIKIIQFEYGYINIRTHYLLKDFYDYLSAFNMKIGKIYPTYVDFKDYEYTDENFFGPNYIAVHSSCSKVIDSLSN